MTTVAAKDGWMSCDSCWTDANWLHGTSLTKIIRLKSGALLGEAGDNDTRAVVKLLQSCKTFDQLPSAIDLASTKVDCASLIMFPNGDVAMLVIERTEIGDMVHTAGAWRVNRGGAAVGTGAAVAIGAMDAGKSAREAVAIACGRDPEFKIASAFHRTKTHPQKQGGPMIPRHTLTLRQVSRGEWELSVAGGINFPVTYPLTFDQLRYFAAHAANAVASYPSEKIRCEMPAEGAADRWAETIEERRRA